VTDPLPSLRDLARAYEDGSMSPVAVVEGCLERIARLDDALGAFQAVYAEEARAAAGAAEQAIRSGHRIGPFHGVPFALKDIVDLEGRVTTGGSKAMADRVSPTTATIARRLLAAGGVLLGKTRTVEVAFGGWGTNAHMGTPRNPWDARVPRAPGGSSSGSAVAVAARLAACAVGTDTGGSVRLPAAWCGLTGLKVTEGRLPTDGILPLSHTLDTPGPIARTVDDAWIMYRVMEAAEGHRLDRDTPPVVNPRALRLAVLDDATRASLADDVRAAYDATLAALADAGAELAPLTTPIGFAEVLTKSGALSSAEGWVHHGALFERDDAPVDPAVRARLLAGRDVGATDYIRALVDRPGLQAAFLDRLAGFDAMLTPTTATSAPALDEIDESGSPARFTRFANYLGLAALSVPTGLTETGLPASLQIIVRPHDEARARAIGHLVEGLGAPLGLPPLARA
jgi:aspartyl-tRNA(Asn)/glutamyl-tRNA(Gln) amidotransferase subunit A